MPSFTDKFRSLAKQQKTFLSIGLDPDLTQIAPYRTATCEISSAELSIFEAMTSFQSSKQEDYLIVKNFLRAAIRDTKDYCIAYKLNLAFYEQWWFSWGQLLLWQTLQDIRKLCPQHLIILDGKRNDIANTLSHYSTAYFPYCDALTGNPYMGLPDASEEASEKAWIMICLTSNTDATSLQLHGNPPLYMRVAQKIDKLMRSCQSGLNYWLVIGATQPLERLQQFKKDFPNLYILIPGIGAQGGNFDACYQIFGDQALYHCGREILYPKLQANENITQARHRICSDYRSKCRNR